MKSCLHYHYTIIYTLYHGKKAAKTGNFRLFEDFFTQKTRINGIIRSSLPILVVFHRVLWGEFWGKTRQTERWRRRRRYLRRADRVDGLTTYSPKLSLRVLWGEFWGKTRHREKRNRRCRKLLLGEYLSYNKVFPKIIPQKIILLPWSYIQVVCALLYPP